MGAPLTLDQLIGEGRFREALAAVGHRTSDPLRVAIRADLLLQTGRVADAAVLAERALTLRRLDKAVAARCLSVLGRTWRTRGDLGAARECLQKSVTLSDEAGDPEQACWSALRLLLTMADAYGSDAAFGMVRSVRTRVSQIGNPHTACCLHVNIAEIETKRGFLDSAARHVRIATSLLEGHPNYWLEARVEMAAFAIDYLGCDVTRAAGHLRRALDCAVLSGTAFAGIAAISNLGHLRLLSSDYERAARWFHLGLRAWREGGALGGSMSDGQAQVHLALGDLRGCERSLSQVHLDKRPESAPYFEVWTIPTRVRLLLKRQQPGEAAELASHGMAAARKRDDPLLAEWLQLLTSEALLMAGRSREAEDLLCTVAAHWVGAPLETLARAARVSGKMYAARGNPAAAVEIFERTARMLAGADECSRAEVLDDYVRLLWPGIASVGGNGTSSLAGLPCLRQAPSRVTVHTTEATLLGPVTPPLSILSTLERAAMLVTLAGRPQTVGQELQDTLRRCGAIGDAAMVARSGESAPELVASWGAHADLAAMLSAPRGVQRIRLGRWREKDIELLVDVALSLESRAAVTAVRTLVEAGLEIEGARCERRERAALWPLDEGVETRQGVFASRAMTDLIATARKIAASNATVLITGETGTGKEVLARIIHEASSRASRPFIPFNCSAVPREMLDSQLFGHRRGAFTGAIGTFPGVIRTAVGGTLLLDEIAEVPTEVQPKLLRFLDAQEIQPLGEGHPVTVDVRLLAATNADLEQLVATGRLRDDLYYRLNVIRLHVPPLRERREEIPVLALHFLRRFTGENDKENVRIAEETMEYLLLYRWPGNVRELLNQMRRLAALAENGGIIMPEHLPREIVTTRLTVPASDRDLHSHEVVVRLDQPLAAAIEHVERAVVQWTLRSAGGRVDAAAAMLGLSRKGLYLKRQRLGLDAGEEPARSDSHASPSGVRPPRAAVASQLVRS